MKINRLEQIDYFSGRHCIVWTVGQQVTGVWQKWRFSAPQTVLWFIKHWFSASTFVVKIATFAKRQNVIGKRSGRHNTDKRQ